MPSYVALLRGITPSNPNMRNEKLRGVFEGIGFQNVQTVISSGNVLFEAESENSKELEEIIQKNIDEQLGFSSSTIILSKDDLNQLLKRNPFNNIDDTSKSKLNVTFLKNKPETDLEFPYHAENEGFVIVSIEDQAIFSFVNLTISKTPDLMQWLEKEFGKEITTRTWKSIGRIVQKLNSSK